MIRMSEKAVRWLCDVVGSVSGFCLGAIIGASVGSTIGGNHIAFKS